MRTVVGMGALTLLIAVGAGACTGNLGGQGADGSGPGGIGDGDGPGSDGDGPGGDGDGGAAPEPTILDERVTDYYEALRLAAVKLTDAPPTLEQIRSLETADDPEAAYETLVDEFLDSPRFHRRMIRFWRDTFRLGGDATLDTGPVFAARLMDEGRPYTDLFTATENTCPSYDQGNDAFVDGDCDNGVDVHAGLLTNPGVQSHFYANMAFRRVRWVQEIFACSKFPAEYREDPEDRGNGQYTAPWDFETIAAAPIDFLDTSSVVCANCHATMNRLAPLFLNFDENGMLQAEGQVMTPTAPDPTVTTRDHLLPDGVGTAWRRGVEVSTLPELGAALADDDTVAACLSARLWNFTMSKEDIVSGLAVVPAEVVGPYVTELLNNGGDMRAVLRAMLLSEDFVSF
ncbi:MAG: DUF1549 domain-containing protein [Myxococcota bacterium]